MRPGKVFQVEQQTPLIKGEKVDVKDSRALMSSSISESKLSSYRLFVLIYSWRQADKVETLLERGCYSPGLLIQFLSSLIYLVGHCLLVWEVGERKREEEKWHVLVVVLHACVNVAASYIRSKMCDLNQRRSAGI